MAKQRAVAGNEKAFLRRVDSQLAAIWRNLPSPKNLNAVRDEITGFLDRVTHSRREDGRTGVEPNRLLNCDWREKCEINDRYRDGLQLNTGGSLQKLARILALPAQQYQLLEQVLLELVTFAWNARTKVSSRPFGRKLKSAIGDYLEARGLDPALTGKGRGRPTETSYAIDDEKCVASWRSSGLTQKEFGKQRYDDANYVSRAQARIRARANYKNRRKLARKKRSRTIPVK